MKNYDVIIIGAGPAGSSCARRLHKEGLSVALIDRKIFPRPKLCAGWITPDVFKDLEINPGDYPHGLKTFRRLMFYVYGIRIPVKTCQYSVRRFEFDHWLMKKTDISPIHHRVRHIKRDHHDFLIDGVCRGRYLVGAGGTHCPVYRHFFKKDHPRFNKNHIVTMEEEFREDWTDPDCYLWFFENGLPGYAWYVPKGNGFLNVGIGGKQESMRKKGKNILYYWDRFTTKLVEKGLVKPRGFQQKGYTYYLNQKRDSYSKNRIYLTGDAAGLATQDMGEGIGPAIKSGLLAADSILKSTPYNLEKINRFSLGKLIFNRYQ